MEIWKEIVDANGMYEVSDLGNVRSWFRLGRKGSVSQRAASSKIIKPSTEGGYKRVTLRMPDGTCRYEGVHVLVLETFVGPRPGHPRQVHAAHNSGDNTDNRLTNLQWKTVVENQADKIDHGTAGIGEKNPMALLTEDQVKVIKARLALRCRGDIKKIAQEFNVKPATIYDINSGRTWSSTS